MEVSPQTFSVADDHRFRRSLLQFYRMISCATNNDPLKYNFYGCYCGLGGTGTPVDALDRLSPSVFTFN